MLLDIQLLPLKRAAERGDVDAQFRLACALTAGSGAAPDDEKALALFESVVAQKEKVTYINYYHRALFSVGYLRGRMGDLHACDFWFKRTLAEMSDYSPEHWDTKLLNHIQTFTAIRQEPGCQALP